jgi:N-dimethylarginine dimethylaminohydrolase
MPKYLMCPPKYFGIDYSINPWMNVADKVEHAEAVSQWKNLVDTIETFGKVKLMEPENGFPDLVFTANAGLFWPNNYNIMDAKGAGQVLLSDFKYKERQGETNYYERAFGKLNYRTVRFPKINGASYEGAGDSLWDKDNRILWQGSGFRSSPVTSYEIKKWLDPELPNIISLGLVNPNFYHLDTCFCPLKDGDVIAYEDAFDGNSWLKIKANTKFVIKVNKEEAEAFACNCIHYNKIIVIPKLPFYSNLKGRLKNRGYSVHEVDMSEFMKSGGACKCLTLRID